MKQGRLFAFSRFFVRLKIGRWKADVAAPSEPTVFVCSHKNMGGPLATLAWLPFPVRPWVLHVFTSRETCRAQYRDYTFSRRFGMPRPLAAALAWAVSGYVSALMESMGAIPVYRGSLRIGDTFQATVAALQAGESVLIFPDVDYTDESEGIGAVYDGFLKVDRFWRRVSREPLRFVPLKLDPAGRRIVALAPVSFDPAADRRTELIRVREELRRQLNREKAPGGER